MTMHELILTRHGQSVGNQRNEFTGWSDLPLTAQGEAEARTAGQILKSHGLTVDAAFTSALQRAATTCKLLLEELGQPTLTPIANAALNERDYGALTGLNKDGARAKWGEEQVHLWRRSFAVAPPEGESLRDTVARVLPYYVHTILPVVLSQPRTLVVAHGNSLRALIMALEGHTPTSITQVELGTGEIRHYVLSGSAKVLTSEILGAAKAA